MRRPGAGTCAGVSLLSGTLMVLLGGLAWLVGTHFMARRFFDRPGPVRHPLFAPVMVFLRWGLFLIGAGILARTSPPTGLAAVILLAGVWAYRVYVRSAFFQQRLLRREVERLRAAHPDLTEPAILYKIVMRRHGEWGEELIEQMVTDYPTVETLAPMIARMERGFRGFR